MNYKCLNKQNYLFEDFKISPIRMGDRYEIMKWRNEQMYHLRQTKELTKYDQDLYFSKIKKSKLESKPKNIIFSFLHKSNLVGYGALVHISWIDKNAEISFLINTELEKIYFSEYWNIFLKLIQKVAFDELSFKKIYTYSYDIRPKLYNVLEKNSFQEEANLIDHVFIQNKFYNVRIHSLYNHKIGKIKFREVLHSDLKLTFKWINDNVTRKNSLNPKKITYADHKKWFINNLKIKKSKYYIFTINDKPFGQVRLKFENGFWIVNYLVDKNFRGIGLGFKILNITINKHKNFKIKAYVLKSNIASVKIFNKLKFKKKVLSNRYEFIN